MIEEVENDTSDIIQRQAVVHSNLYIVRGQIFGGVWGVAPPRSLKNLDFVG